MAACPYCGAEKRREQPLCRYCMQQLPARSRELLEERVADDIVGYQRKIQLLSALRRGVALSDVRVVA